MAERNCLGHDRILERSGFIDRMGALHRPRDHGIVENSDKVSNLCRAQFARLSSWSSSHVSLIDLCEGGGNFEARFFSESTEGYAILRMEDDPRLCLRKTFS